MLKRSPAKLSSMSNMISTWNGMTQNKEVRLKIEGLLSKKIVLCRLLMRITKTLETSNESLDKSNKLVEYHSMLRKKVH